MKQCARCGITREARKTSPLCKDCTRVLTPAEMVAWR